MMVDPVQEIPKPVTVNQMDTEQIPAENEPIPVDQVEENHIDAPWDETDVLPVHEIQGTLPQVVLMTIWIIVSYWFFFLNELI